jgi:hypothetical protein
MSSSSSAAVGQCSLARRLCALGMKTAEGPRRPNICKLLPLFFPVLLKFLRANMPERRRQHLNPSLKIYLRLAATTT